MGGGGDRSDASDDDESPGADDRGSVPLVVACCCCCGGGCCCSTVSSWVSRSWNTLNRGPRTMRRRCFSICSCSRSRITLGSGAGGRGRATPLLLPRAVPWPCGGRLGGVLGPLCADEFEVSRWWPRIGGADIACCCAAAAVPGEAGRRPRGTAGWPLAALLLPAAVLASFPEAGGADVAVALPLSFAVVGAGPPPRSCEAHALAVDAKVLPLPFASVATGDAADGDEAAPGADDAVAALPPAPLRDACGISMRSASSRASRLSRSARTSRLRASWLAVVLSSFASREPRISNSYLACFIGSGCGYARRKLRRRASSSAMTACGSMTSAASGSGSTSPSGGVDDDAPAAGGSVVVDVFIAAPSRRARSARSRARWRALSLGLTRTMLHTSWRRLCLMRWSSGVSVWNDGV
mmetsp:Transcript_48312/g.149051  ORF Transcript_48312/g.149051 Transcript_48312/m.149051 type:complete len:410 (+) Transcript_48312:606-1835(+)